MAIGFSLAAFSYSYIERPLRYGALLSGPRRAIGLSLAGCVATAAAIGALYLATPSISLSVVSRHSADWFPNYNDEKGPDARGCFVSTTKKKSGGETINIVTRAGCDGPATAQTLHIVGDSHSWAYMTMAELYALRTGVRVVRRDFNGCPLLATIYFSLECPIYWKEVAQALAAETKPGDVIFLPALRTLRMRNQLGADLEPSFPDITAFMAQLHSLDLARETLRVLTKPGVAIVVEAPKPLFKTASLRCADWFDRGNPVCSYGDTVSRAEEEAHRRPVMAFLADLQREFPTVTLWDPMPLLCESTECRIYRDGRPLFFDGDHLSGYGGRVLLPAFAEEMAQRGLPPLPEAADSR
ncbi:SGNH hydrolase domain-containing protein [Methylosinus sporium]|uniref:SGNH hydrolase domain-containing protein n=1 Tax=Methylosinus sporium TaxID=428 RepID=UPI001FEDF2B8|nr:SGNH hydrolase domain-containing protein [Methylosinus sporium]